MNKISNSADKNPYRKEILGIIILGFLLLTIETWRRWDNLLSYAYWDDIILITLAFVAAFFLYKKTFLGQLFWLFTCGYALNMITESCMSTWYRIEEIDASGFSNHQVLWVKIGMYVLVVCLCVRAFKLLLKYRFE